MTIWELEQSHEFGTYAALQVSKKSQDQLAGWLYQQGIEHDDPGEFHCTVMYSKTPMPQAVAVAGPLAVTASVTGWKLLGDHATVLLISCDSAEKIYHLFRKHGASHDWPQYIPHITVNSEQHLHNLPENLPEFTLTFDQLVVKPIKK